jgi:hypothetical protein
LTNPLMGWRAEQASPGGGVRVNVVGRAITPEQIFVVATAAVLAVAAWALSPHGWIAALGCLLGMAVAASGRWMLASVRNWGSGLVGAGLIGFGVHAVLVALARPDAQAAGLAIGLAIVLGWQARATMLAASGASSGQQG